jgi:5'-nucleotidase
MTSPGDDDRIALIDLDGTIADYDTEMQAQMRLIVSPAEADYFHRPQLDEDEAPYIRARRKMIQRQPGFWRNLRPMERGFEVVEELRRFQFQLHVLTKGPTSTPNAWSEKLEWCKCYLDDALVTVTGDKSLVYGRVLFDDWPLYFEKWLTKRPRGLVICLDHPWNEEYKRGGTKENSNVLRYDDSSWAHSELADRLKRAYERAPKENL